MFIPPTGKKSCEGKPKGYSLKRLPGIKNTITTVVSTTRNPFVAISFPIQRLIWEGIVLQQPLSLRPSSLRRNLLHRLLLSLNDNLPWCQRSYILVIDLKPRRTASIPFQQICGNHAAKNAAMSYKNCFEQRGLQSRRQPDTSHSVNTSCHET